jgi:hypothetical protein
MPVQVEIADYQSHHRLDAITRTRKVGRQQAKRIEPPWIESDFLPGFPKSSINSVAIRGLNASTR